MISARIPTDEYVRINPNDIQAMNYYSDYLNCSRKELEEAINKIGNCLSEVQIYLVQTHSATKNMRWHTITESMNDF